MAFVGHALGACRNENFESFHPDCNLNYLDCLGVAAARTARLKIVKS